MTMDFGKGLLSYLHLRIVLPRFLLISSSQQDAYDISSHRPYAPSIILHRFRLT